MKKGIVGKGQQIAAEGREILLEVGIDPVIDPANLVHAPLYGKEIHLPSRQLAILEELRELKARAAARSEYVEVLRKYGEMAKNAPANK